MKGCVAMDERCSICGCEIHREGDYALPTVKGRSHATKHYFVPERFFGRSSNRPNTQRESIFNTCPWDSEKKTAVFCYECHEELLHNPVLLPQDIEDMRRLVEMRGLNESIKSESREKIAGRIRLFHEIIVAGVRELLEKGNSKDR